MSEYTKENNSFIGYEYKDVTIDKSMESVYTDAYQNFGWSLDDISSPISGINSIALKFKRDRKIRNKAELTRLQRQFDSYASEVLSMERSKIGSASLVAYSVGLVGTACLAGSTFAFLGGLIPLCIVLAIPGFVGWILPYFLYNSTYAKKSAKLSPLIEKKYDEIYDVCERGNSLIEN